MKSSKNIKVYGTLVNHTLDSTLADETHNDALMNAYQLFDGRFGDSPLPNNFQDVINKRITDITFDGGTTTIENREPVTENHYTLVVNGDTNLNGDVHITEDLHVDGDTHLGDTYIDGSLYVTGQTDLTLGDLGNVNKNADSASAGTFLKYNGTEWLPVSIALSDTFGDIGNPFEGAILKYKNGAWTLTVDEDHDTNHLNNMHDVDISNISNGSILKWNTSTDMWEIGSDLGSILPQGQEGKVLKYINGNWVAADDLVGATKMSELSDVDTTNLAVGKILKWNGTNWYVADETGGGTQLPAGSEGKVLKYKSGAWTADDDLVGATKLSDLSDVDSSVDSAADGCVLKYDSSDGLWKAVDESGNSASSPYIYRTQTAHLTKVKSMFSGSEVISSSAIPSTTFGIIYPNNRYTDIYVSNDITLQEGESISSITLTQLPTERGQKVFDSGVTIDDGMGQWTMTGNGQSYTWTTHSDGYAISPGTRKNTTPIKVYATIQNALYSLNGGAFNPDISVGTMHYNNYASGPKFSTDINYNPAYDSSLRSTKHFLAIPEGTFVEITSQSNYKQDLKSAYIFAYEILSNGTIETYTVLPNGYKEQSPNTHPYDWLTTDFYKVVVRDDRSGADYTSISAATAENKMTFVDVPYGQCYTAIKYDNSCITMPNTLTIEVVTVKPASAS